MDDTDVHNLLHRSRAGDVEASGMLLAHLYEELRSIARRVMRENGRRRVTLQTTALVHEAFLKVCAGKAADFESRSHFFGVAAKAMRSVVIDHYRASNAKKRGGDRTVFTIAAGDAAAPSADDPTAALDLLALEHALRRLDEFDDRKARLVELRFYAGLTNEQTAEVLGLSRATVEREWRFAKAWLKAAVDGPDAPATV